MGAIVNLNQFRKNRAKAEKKAAAAANRVKHGRNKAEREKNKLETDLHTKDHEDKLLD
ncbi:MAG: DUF4169 family protein [Rhodospirillaceae bacterium]|nr:DUF4169 family protein [Rhodospirillaceae bacterium]MBT5374168.1 DUF4169 family protein [Rhodospirillaceae bacterium]MBT5660221.1 DUF4169 family protein [Rhodospirillaceae bacterium]MBT5751453.1 DUF4169 family protein [Rhodospirillaceae bacterium]